jgi:disease resistance protein RPM1
MVLDLLHAISSEENFVTILDKNEGASSSSQGKVRRLVLQNNGSVEAHMDMQQVRSFISCGFDKEPPRLSFKLIRVLVIEIDFQRNEPWHLKHLQSLLHLRYLRLNAASIVLPAVEIGSLIFLQTLDLGEHGLIEQEVTRSVGLLTKLLCLRFRGWINTVPDGIGKLTSLQELEIYCADQDEEPEAGSIQCQRRFVKELCGIRELRVLRLHGGTSMVTAEDDMVRQLLLNLQKLEILSLKTNSSPVSADTAVWEAEGFLLPRRLRRLSLTWISFSRFPSFCINPSRLPHLSQLSLFVDAMNEQEDMRILGGLPQLCFLDLGVDSIAEVGCNNTRTDDDACLFQKLRRCSLRYTGVRLLLPSQEDSSSVSFSMWNVDASMVLGSKTQDAAGVAPTLMPSIQKLGFTVCVQEMKDGNHNDDCVSLALEYFASLHNVKVCIDCDDDSSRAEVEQVEAVLRRAADLHPNRPTLEVWATGKDFHHSASTPRKDVIKVVFHNR